MIENVEFLFEGSRNGVLLIHGLTGTPAEMKLLGKGLNHAGFTVKGMQLSGHCGSPEDLLATGWHEWYASVEQAAQALRPRVDRLFVAGLSMGALLALLLAARRPQWVDGVGVLGATFRYDGWSTPPIGRLAFMLPWLKRLGVGRSRSFIERPPYGLRDERIRARISAAMMSGDSTVAGLLGNPWYSLAELHGLAAHVRHRLSQVVAPCLVAHATDDDVASPRNARLVATGVSGPVELLWLKDSYHMITLDRDRRLLIARAAAFFNRIAEVPTPFASIDQPCRAIA
ncbi:MAG TPA: alpha/beta fold hydrolase [Rhodanobacteraceae bacterium]